MTNEERDKCIQETHDAVIVLLPDVDNLKLAVWGNGKPGLKEALTVLKTKQDECQKKKAKEGQGIANYLSLAAVLVALFAVLAKV